MCRFVSFPHVVLKFADIYRGFFWVSYPYCHAAYTMHFATIPSGVANVSCHSDFTSIILF